MEHDLGSDGHDEEVNYCYIRNIFKIILSTFQFILCNMFGRRIHDTLSRTQQYTTAIAHIQPYLHTLRPTQATSYPNLTCTLFTPDLLDYYKSL